MQSLHVARKPSLVAVAEDSDCLAVYVSIGRVCITASGTGLGSTSAFIASQVLTMMPPLVELSIVVHEDLSQCRRHAMMLWTA